MVAQILDTSCFRAVDRALVRVRPDEQRVADRVEAAVAEAVGELQGLHEGEHRGVGQQHRHHRLP